MHANAKMPFLHPAPRRRQFRLIIRRRRQMLCQFSRQTRSPRPGRPERAADHRIQNARVARQIARKAGCGARDINDQIDQTGIGIKQRKYLHARRQSGQKPVQRHQRLFGVGRARQPCQQTGAQPLKQGLRAIRPQSGIAGPAFDDGQSGVRQRWRGIRLHRTARREKPFGQLVSARQPCQQPCAKISVTFPAKRRNPRHARRSYRQIMGLRVAHHLQTVFHLAVAGI